MADGRVAVGRFADPIARQLLHADVVLSAICDVTDRWILTSLSI
ncbi:hypothetical protein ACIHDR_46665 [Nocardia sp. NPDC052278]